MASACDNDGRAVPSRWFRPWDNDRRAVPSRFRQENHDEIAHSWNDDRSSSRAAFKPSLTIMSSNKPLSQA